MAKSPKRLELRNQTDGLQAHFQVVDRPFQRLAATDAGWYTLPIDAPKYARAKQKADNENDGSYSTVLGLTWLTNSFVGIEIVMLLQTSFAQRCRVTREADGVAIGATSTCTSVAVRCASVGLG